MPFSFKMTFRGFHILIFYLLIIVRSLGSTIISPSGIKLSTSTVRAALPKELQAEPHRHLYELAENGDVLGSNSVRIRLSSVPLHTTPVKTNPGFFTTLNGVPVNAPNIEAIHKVHTNYTSIYDTRKKQLLALWGPEIHLLPLNKAIHPTLFVNSFRQQSNTYVEPYISIPDDNQDELDYPSWMNIPETFQTAGDTNPDCAAGAIHYFEVLTTIDNTFCAKFGNDITSVITVLQASMDKANEPYASQTCIRLIMIGLQAHCNDPNDPFVSYNGLSGSQMVEKMLRYYQNNFAGLNRDTVVLFTGFGGSNSIGTAYRPGTCEQLGYAWVEGVNPFTLAHEIAHNLNMYHTPNGLIATAGKSRREWWFQADSVANLTSYVDHEVNNRDVSCISTDAPSCDSTCPNACVDNKCIVNMVPSAGLVPCTPAEGFYDCTTRTYLVNSTTSYFTSKADCPAGYNFVQRTYDANDPTMFCCTATSDTTTAQGISTQFTYIRNTYVYQGNTYNNIITRSTNATYELLTFLNTQIVPCDISSQTPTLSVSPSISASVSSSMTHSPTSSVTPAVTSSMSTSTTPSVSSTFTPSKSTAVSPTTSISVTASNIPSLSPSKSMRVGSSKTCGDTFSFKNHLSCKTKVRGKLNIGTVGRVKVFIRVRYGTFQYTFKALGNKRLRAIGFLASTSGNENVGEISQTIVEFKRRRKYIRYYDEQITDLKLTPTKTSCCGNNAIYLYTYIRLCQKDGGGCQTSSSRISIRMKCSMVCKKDTKIFSPLSMDIHNACPACNRIK